MKEKLHEILMDLNRGRIAVSEAHEQIWELFEQCPLPSWLSAEDARLARMYYSSGQKLIAVKYIRDIAFKHVQDPLRWAMYFLNGKDWK